MRRGHTELRTKDFVGHDDYLEKSKVPSTPASVSGFDNSRPSIPSITSSASLELVDNNGCDKLDEYNGLNRPSYVFAKIDAFFTTSANEAMMDLETSCLGPFPNLPHTTASDQTEQPSNEDLTENQQTYFLRLFWEAYHPLLQASDESEFQSLFDLDSR